MPSTTLQAPAPTRKNTPESGLLPFTPIPLEFTSPPTATHSPAKLEKTFAQTTKRARGSNYVQRERYARRCASRLAHATTSGARKGTSSAPSWRPYPKV